MWNKVTVKIGQSKQCSENIFLSGVLITFALSCLTVIRATTVPTTLAELCERAPPHAQPADADYKLEVAGDPDLFLPGELYTGKATGLSSRDCGDLHSTCLEDDKVFVNVSTAFIYVDVVYHPAVSLQGVDSGQGPTPFIGFTIWAELEEVTTEADKVPTVTTSLSNHSLGTFQAYDAHAKLHEFCKPGVENATAHSKTEIQVSFFCDIQLLFSSKFSLLIT